jgi:hypothetical protein
MDAYIHKHNQTQSCNWSSINWDDWQIGEQQQETEMGKNLSQDSITSKAGVQVFERFLSLHQVPQVIVSTRDLQPRIEQWIKLEFLRNKESSNNADTLSLHSRANLQNEYVPARNNVEQIVC